MKFKPTDQQVTINETVKKSHLGERTAVNAFAGTGKTSTLQLLAEDALEGLQVLYLAFNKSIKEEAAKKFPTNVTAKTGHGLAYGPMKRNFIRDRDPMAGKLMLAREIEGNRVLSPLMDITSGDRRQAAFAVVRTLNRFCQSADPHVKPEHVPPAYGAAQNDKRERNAVLKTISTATQKVWEMICAPNSRVPINFDIYLKAWALTRPALPYDVILFDECQDANPVLLDLVMPQGASQIYVGDKHQQIYSFRGAVNAMDAIGGDQLPLSKSFRFGENIAAEANIVLEMLGEKIPLEGAGPRAGVVIDEYDGNDYDAVLCRGNAGAISEIVAALDTNKSVAVVGGKAYIDQLVKLLYSVYDLWNNQYVANKVKPKHPEIALFSDWEEFEKYSETDDGAEYRFIVRLVNERGDYVPVLASRLKRETTSEKQAEIVVSTAHKAKGREWDRVRFCTDWRPLVENDDDGKLQFHEEEARLFYVATTRAQEVLNMAGYAARTRMESDQLKTHRSSKGADPEEGVDLIALFNQAKKG